MRYVFLMLLAAFALAGCESTGSGEPVDIPDVNFNCTTTLCRDESGLRDAVVVFSLSGCAPDQINFNSVATGTASASCSAGGCTGRVSNWRDATTGVAMTQIPARSYEVCGWIDLDNDAKDGDDAFAEDDVFVSALTSIDLTDWSVTYSFSRKTAPRQ